MKNLILIIFFLPLFSFGQETCQKTAGSNQPLFTDGHTFTTGDTIGWDFFYLNKPCWTTSDSVFIWVWPEGTPSTIINSDTIYRAPILPLFNLPSNSFGSNHKDFKVKMNFDLPTGNYKIQVSFAPANNMSYVNNGSIVTGIKDSVIHIDYAIRYFNLQGIEIEKPSEGLYLWKSENGESGKSFIY